MAILNRQRRPLFARIRTTKGNFEQLEAGALQELLQQLPDTLEAKQELGSWVQIGNQIMLVAVRSISQYSGHGESRGMLVTGRYSHVE